MEISGKPATLFHKVSNTHFLTASGNELVRLTSEQFNTVVENAVRVSSLAREVAASSQVQKLTALISRFRLSGQAALNAPQPFKRLSAR